MGEAEKPLVTKEKFRSQLHAAIRGEHEAFMSKLDSIVMQLVDSVQDVFVQLPSSASNSTTEACFPEATSRTTPIAKEEKGTGSEPSCRPSGKKYAPAYTSDGGVSNRERDIVVELTKHDIRAVSVGWDLDLLRNAAHSKSLFHKLSKKASVASWIQWWYSINEPERIGCVADFVQGKFFELVCLGVIFANASYSAVETNYMMQNLTLKRNFAMTCIEWLFTGFYACELTAKIWVHRLYFFCNYEMGWNILDFTLVMSGLVDLLGDMLSKGANFGNPSFIRIVRLARLARLVRIVRVLKFFQELRLMMRCVMGSFMSLFWAFLLIMLFSRIFALILVQRMVQYLVRDDSNPLQRPDVKEYFGSVEEASFSLFHAISGGDWKVVYKVVQQTGWENAGLFMMYFLFVWLSLTNIITCIFVEKAMRLAQPDLEQLLLERRKADLATAEEIEKVYVEIQGTNSILYWDQFERAMKDPRIAYHLELTGLDINDTYMFFHMLSSIAGSENVDRDTFIRGCLKMRGFAMNIDLIQLNYEMRVISKHQQKLILDLHNTVQYLVQESRVKSRVAV